jgi:hypothetical protein
MRPADRSAPPKRLGQDGGNSDAAISLGVSALPTTEASLSAYPIYGSSLRAGHPPKLHLHAQGDPPSFCT